jgi:hypothetical protein
MQLRWSGEEAQFCNAGGEVIAFDPSAEEPGPHALLVKQSAMQDYLDSHGLSLIWTVLGAKQRLTGSMRDEKWIGELQINGVYRLENGMVTGGTRSHWQGPNL